MYFETNCWWAHTNPNRTRRLIVRHGALRIEPILEGAAWLLGPYAVPERDSANAAAPGTRQDRRHAVLERRGIWGVGGKARRRLPLTL